MKILVVFTGGTIGSSEQEGWIAPDESRKRLLLEHYKKENPQRDVIFESVSPYTLLSENLSGDYINKLVSCVCDHADKGYDGIIVAHGTDSLQYSAAALSFALGGRLPVAVVSSNYHLSDSRANGHQNFAAAVELVMSGRKGVFVPYLNSDGKVYIHHGSRLTRHGEMTDDVISLGEDDTPAYRGLGKYTLTNMSNVLNIFSYPGDSFSYNLDKIKAVIIQPYHSGTLNTQNEYFVDFCKRAGEMGIPVFAVNLRGGITYESMKDLAGVTLLPPCAAIPIYIKVWIAVSRGEKNIAAFVKTPLCGEFV